MNPFCGGSTRSVRTAEAYSAPEIIPSRNHINVSRDIGKVNLPAAKKTYNIVQKTFQIVQPLRDRHNRTADGVFRAFYGGDCGDFSDAYSGTAGARKIAQGARSPRKTPAFPSADRSVSAPRVKSLIGCPASAVSFRERPVFSANFPSSS